MRMYYMTCARWGEVILNEQRLKLSRFYESNDPFELKLVDNRQPEARRMVRMISEYFNRTIGMICFGASWASPVMWAHYAAKHTGLCLGFDIEDKLLSQVKYTDAKITVPFGEHLPRHGLSEELLLKILLTKATDWSYEREYRALSDLKTKDPKAGLHYLDFGPQVQLREVIIGHRCSWTIAKTRKLIRDVAASVRICKARPGFGKFEMVERKDVRAATIKPPRKPEKGTVGLR